MSKLCRQRTRDELSAEIRRLLAEVAHAVHVRSETEKTQEADIERLRVAIAPFASLSKGIPDNWPGCCQLRIDTRPDGSECLAYHGVPEMERGRTMLPTLAEWREAAEAGAEDSDA